MSTITKTTDVCDLPDGGGEHPAYRTIEFGIDGKAWEIDVCSRAALRMRQELEPYTDVARGAGRPGKARSRPMSSRRRSADIRRWALAQRLISNERGRIPASVIAKYEAEHEAMISGRRQ